VALLSIVSVGVAVTAHADDVDTDTSRLDHLLQAATHLEQAGRTDLAAGVYAQIEAGTGANRQRLIDARRARIRQLELEIARLQASPAAEPPGVADQIVVELKLIEFSWAKLQQSGLSLVSLRNLLESNETPAILDEDGQISEFIELLCKDGLAQVLSRPKLTTISGQPATVEIGQDSATVSPGSRSRLRFQCTPRVVDGGKLQLEIDLRVQVAAGEKALQDDAGVLGLKTQVELRSGDTMILGGQAVAGQQQAAAADTKSVLVLLTARSAGVPGQKHPP
jgi:Flp pilus assembly secretin CpaC